MVNSNERGRALEYKIAIEVHDFLADSLRLDVISTDGSKRLNFRDKLYFDELDEPTKSDFSLCATTFVKWFDKQGWLKDAATVTIDRFGDDRAKGRDPTDIQLGISNTKGQLTFKNFSLKHRHDALKHPRLPSLAQQCGIGKGTKEDSDYRKRYAVIWEKFGKKVSALNSTVKTFDNLGKIDSSFKANHLYAPLMKNAVDFLIKHSKSQENASALFQYLVGKTDYIVIKNTRNNIEVKYFSDTKIPEKYSVIYPYQEKGNNPRNYFLLEFSNGWKIRVRIHNASSRIFEEDGRVNDTEKMDPICINLSQLISTDTIQKR